MTDDVIIGHVTKFFEFLFSKKSQINFKKNHEVSERGVIVFASAAKFKTRRVDSTPPIRIGLRTFGQFLGSF